MSWAQWAAVQEVFALVNRNAARGHYPGFHAHDNPDPRASRLVGRTNVNERYDVPPAGGSCASYQLPNALNSAVLAEPLAWPNRHQDAWPREFGIFMKYLHPTARGLFPELGDVEFVQWMKVLAAQTARVASIPCSSVVDPAPYDFYAYGETVPSWYIRPGPITDICRALRGGAPFWDRLLLGPHLPVFVPLGCPPGQRWIDLPISEPDGTCLDVARVVAWEAAVRAYPLDRRLADPGRAGYNGAFLASFVTAATACFDRRGEPHAWTAEMLTEMAYRTVQSIGGVDELGWRPFTLPDGTLVPDTTYPIRRCDPGG